jgi:hypothetical protein
MTAISRTISYRHVAGSYVGHTAAMTLTYNTTDPFTVSADFGPGNATWNLWRDVLAGRVDGSARYHASLRFAEGGAACEVNGVWAYLTLAGLDGTVVVRFAAAALDAFLRGTERLVPYGTETIDLAAELDALLKDGAR